VLPDGPSRLEGLALGARLTGAWAEAILPPAAAGVGGRRRHQRRRRP